ncbi:MAG: ribonuclease P protein component 4 [Candidatus Micrarchaeia archaeon]
MLNNKKIIKQIASERIIILFGLAEEMQELNPEFSRRYIKLLRKISEHYKVKIPKEIKNNICRNCNAVLIPGKTSTIRLVSSKKYIAKRCLICGNEIHIFYKNKK